MIQTQNITSGEPLDTHCELTDVLWEGKQEIELCPRHYKEWLEAQLPGTVAPGPSEPSVPITITTEGTVDVAEESLVSDRERPVTFSFIPEDVLIGIRPIQEQATADLAQIEHFTIQSDEQSNLIQQMLVATKRTIKELDSQRLGATKSLTDVKRTIDGWFKPAKDRLQAFESKLKGLVLIYTEAAAAAKLKALQEGRHEEALALPDPELAPGISRREQWRYEVVDAAQVPAQYWTLNDKLIRDQIQREKGGCTIPGLRIWDQGTLAVTT